MIGPNILFCDFTKDKPNTITVSYINPDCGWKHKLIEGEIITHVLNFDLERCMIRQLLRLSNSTLLSINPLNPREMLYHSTGQRGNELSLLVVSETGIEIEETISIPDGTIETISYCLFNHSKSSSLYYWSFADRKLILINNKAPNDTEFRVASSSSTLCFMGNKHICFRQTGFLNQLASSGGNLPSSVSRLISGFLKNKYSA